MLRHFKVWPENIDKNNLYYEQKAFLIYLAGSVPSLDDWAIQVEYKIQKQKIDDLTEKDIVLSKTELDLAKIHGKEIEQLKKDALKQEKEIRLLELNKKFGVNQKDEDNEINNIPYKVSRDNEEIEKREKLWDILQGKGIIKNKKEDNK